LICLSLVYYLTLSDKQINSVIKESLRT